MSEEEILEEMAVEEKKETDTFSNILTSMIPLVILPTILPMFQQTLSQTLSSSTVNVKVESATSIIPISIESSTVIIPIEIRASQVTLNVNITSQTTTLNVNITGSITLNVNVTNSVINVNVTGTANIRITGQTVGVFLESTYRTYVGEEIDLISTAKVEPFGYGNIATWNPPSGSKYLIEGFNASYHLPRDTEFRPSMITVVLAIGNYEVAWITLTDSQSSGSIELIRAIPSVTGYPIIIKVRNYSSCVVIVSATVFAYEVS